MPAAEVAERYAQAAFAYAAAHQAQPALADELAGVAALVRQSPELQHFLAHPCLPVTLKQALLRDLLQDRVGAMTLQVLGLLVAKRRERILSEVADRVVSLLQEQRGLLTVRLTSALPLAPAEQDDLNRRLSGLLRATVNLELAVDPRLLGGLIIRVGDWLIDGSCRGQLEAMREKLLQN